MKNLIGLDKVVDFSFIAEHMLFKKTFMQELINDISNSTVEGSCWFEKILNASTELSHSGFSEFETYGTFVWTKHYGFYDTQKLNTFRNAGMVKGRWIDDDSLEKMAVDIDTALFERYSTQPFPYNIPSKISKWKCQWHAKRKYYQ